jgi:RNA polymerase sigma factor (TIGR02999 family)
MDGTLDPVPGDRRDHRPPATPVTLLLQRWSEGDPHALEELAPLVYGELRRLARRALARERPGHTLQPTALVHEVYLRLVRRDPPHLDRSPEFFAVAAQLMRRILVDHARARLAAKRGGGQGEEAVEAAPPAAVRTVDLLVLDGALDELERLDRALRRIVDLRFFAGFTVAETAAALGVSEPTVKRGWRLARAWLTARLADGADGP